MKSIPRGRVARRSMPNLGGRPHEFPEKWWPTEGTEQAECRDTFAYPFSAAGAVAPDPGHGTGA